MTRQSFPFHTNHTRRSDERYFAPSQPGSVLTYTQLCTLTDLPGTQCYNNLHSTDDLFQVGTESLTVDHYHPRSPPSDWAI